MVRDLLNSATQIGQLYLNFMRVLFSLLTLTFLQSERLPEIRKWLKGAWVTRILEFQCQQDVTGAELQVLFENCFIPFMVY